MNIDIELIRQAIEQAKRLQQASLKRYMSKNDNSPVLLKDIQIKCGMEIPTDKQDVKASKNLKQYFSAGNKNDS